MESADIVGARSPLVLLLLMIILYFAVVVFLCTVFRSLKPKEERRAGQLSRQRLAHTLRVYGILDIIDLMQALISVFMCALYVVETYGIRLPFFPFSEQVITVFLVADYVLRSYLSRNRQRHLLSFFPVVDVFTIAPVLYQWMGRQEDAAPSGSTSVLLRMVRISKLLRVLRSIRLVRAMPGGGVTREIFRLCCITATLILIASGVLQVFECGLDLPLEGYGLPFHEAFYLITIEVLGRPRIPVSGANSNMLLILVVMLSIMLIPKQVNEIWQVMQREPLATRVKYKRRNDTHVVIVGHVDFAVLNLLLYEIYHPDRGSLRPCDVVVLSPRAPDSDLCQLLDNPAYQGHVQYLQGSPHNDVDLGRAMIESAAAVMVIANKFPSDPEWEESRISSIILAVKAARVHAHALADAGNDRPKLRVLAQVMRQETRNRLLQMPGWNRETDVCLVTGEVTAAMLTVSATHRGLAVLALNLISHAQQESCAFDDPCEAEYHEGCRQELYHCSIPPKTPLEEKTVHEGAIYMLFYHRMVLVAVRKKTPRGNLGELVLFPDDQYRMKSGDRVFVIARSMHKVVSVVKGTTANPHNVAFGFLNYVTHSQTAVGKDSRNRHSTGSSAEHSPYKKQVVRVGNTFVLEGEPENVLQSHVGKVKGAVVDASAAVGHVAHVVKRFGQRTLTSSNLAAFTGQAKGETSAGDDLADDLGVDWVVRSRSATSQASITEKYADLQEMLAKKYGGNLQALESDVFQLRQSVLVGDVCGSLSANGEVNSMQSVPYFERKNVASMVRSHKAFSIKSSVTLGEDLSDLNDHIIVCGANERSLVTVACMVKNRHPEQQVVLLYNGETDTIDNEAQAQGLTRTGVAIVFGKAACVQDLQTLFLERARAVIVAPSQAPSREWGDPVSGLEYRRVIDSDTILTTNIVATFPSRRAEFTPELSRSNGDSSAQIRDVWTVTELVQEGSLSRFWGMSPEAEGARLFKDVRWMAAAPVNVSPLFAAGHIVTTTAADRFIVDSFFNPSVLIVYGRLFGLSGLLAGEGDETEEQAGTHAAVFQMPVNEGGLEMCKTYGDLCEALLEFESPLLAVGLFRYPQGGPTSYSFIVSSDSQAAAASRTSNTEKLDGQGFAMPADSVPWQESKPTRKRGRLPYVVTNPDPELVLSSADLVFVLGIHPSRPAQQTPVSQILHESMPRSLHEVRM